MKKIVVLGAGMVGSAMARDLANAPDKFEVTALDIDPAALEKLQARDGRIDIGILDLSDTDKMVQKVRQFDVVVSAVPGFMGFATLKALIEARKDVIDISFFPEDALELDALAKQNKVTAIVDIGVAPGMPNVMLGYYNTIMEIHTVNYYVGGLPKARSWPFQYKAPFSPIDVLEEYTRPARYVENGQMITRPALSEAEFLEFDGVGTLEAFNTDGLRSLIQTMPHIPNMKEKTLRYPGHIDYIKALKTTGFFGENPILVNGQEIKPMEFTSKILFSDWKLGDTEPELTVMRVEMEGSLNGKPARVTYHLHDEYDPVTETSSMARTTGYTATAAVHLFCDGLFGEHGVFPPELVGTSKEVFDYFLKYLADRGVVYRLEEVALR